MGKIKMQKQRSWVVAIVAVIIAVAFSGVSILCTTAINRNLNTLSVHPFAVSTAILGIKNSVSDSRIRLSRLTMYNTQQDVEIVRNAVGELQSNNTDKINYVIKNYLGSATESQQLKMILDTLYAEADGFLSTASTRSIEENEQYIVDHFDPIYTEFASVTESMMSFINNTVNRLGSESHTIQTYLVVFALLISACLIIFAILYQRSMTRQIQDKETYYRDFLFRVLSENIDTVFMIYNVDDHSMEFVSTNTMRMMGLDHYALEDGSEDIFAYCDKSQCEELRQAFQSEVLHTQMQTECTVRNPVTGGEKTMKITLYPTKEDGRINRYILSVLDQTEAKRNQQILRDALANAQHANEAKSNFLSRMSHEIRTPMNAIIGMGTIATVSMDKPAKLEDCLSKIMISSKHLLLLINDILDMSKIESGKFTLSSENFSLAMVVGNVSSIIYGQAQAKNQEFDVVCDIPHEELIGDPLRLNQILINLLSNAVKYTDAHGKIKLTIKEVFSKAKNTTRIQFSIADTGMGMSKEFMERLFQPFEQEGKSAGGTGLGLAITQNLVLMANGTINVESTPGKGSTFVVEMPFAISGRVEEPACSKSFDDLKILVADDDQDTCEHTTLILERLGIEAKWVLSGQEAVEYTIAAHEKGDGYDIVFLDWKMPEVDGLEATRRIRKAVGPETLIIILSAFNWPEIEQEARQAGASAFITKPMFQSTVYNTLMQVMKCDLTAPPIEKTEADFSGKRFLLVEDNAFNLQIAQELLEMVGAIVETAVDGEKAVDCFSKSKPGYYDAIFMDIQMPVMDGYTATRAIRSSIHSDATTIPIIAMTANAFSEDVSAALRAGMNAHVAKPIDLELLYKILGDVLKSSEAEPNLQIT